MEKFTTKEIIIFIVTIIINGLVYEFIKPIYGSLIAFIVWLIIDIPIFLIVKKLEKK